MRQMTNVGSDLDQFLLQKVLIACYCFRIRRHLIFDCAKAEELVR